MVREVKRGKPDEENPYIRLDEQEVASCPLTAGRPEGGSKGSAKPRRGFLLYKSVMALSVVLSAMMGLAGYDRVLLRPDKTVVVIDAQAVPVVRFAAEEMTNFLSRTFGAAIPLVTEPMAGKTSIVLGDNRWSRAAGLDVTTLARDGYYTLVKGGCLYLAGRDDASHDPKKELSGPLSHFHYEHATLFAVYGFLEKHAEVGFWFPGELGTVVTPKTAVEVPTGLSIQAPYFLQRYYSPMRMGALWEGLELSKNEFMNLFMLRGRFGSYRTPNCHGQRACRYVARFAKDHPDWFCLQKDGTRHLTDTYKKPYWRNGKICYTSPIREEMYLDAKAYLSGADAASRGLERWGEAGADILAVGKFFDIMPEDGYMRCECPNCAKAYIDDANYARNVQWGLAAEIGNRLLREGIPGMITLSSYFPYAGCPDFDLPSNILVTVSCKGPWCTGDAKVFANEVAQAKAWFEKTHMRVVTWSYPGKYPGMLDMPDVPQIAPRAWAKSYKALAPYIQGGYAQCDTDRFLYDVLNLQFYAHFSWDRDMDVEAFLGRFHHQLFGEGAEPMQKAFDLLEAKWMKGVCGKPYKMGPIGPMLEMAGTSELWQEIYSPASLKTLADLFDVATARVRAGSREARCIALFRDTLLSPLERRSAGVSVEAELRRRAARKPNNLLVNGDFESADAQGRIDAWTAYSAKNDAQIVLDAQEKVSGVSSLRIATSATGSEGNVYRRGDVSQDIVLEVGATYRLSYFIKTKDVKNYRYREGAGLCWLFGLDKSYQKHPLPLLTGSCDWMHQEMTFVAKEPKNRLQARLCASTGTMWVDGMLLEKISGTNTNAK